MIRPEFVNHRMAGESFKAYRARRKTIAKAVNVHLRGRLSHKSSEPVVLPLFGVDAAMDDQVLRGNIRDVKLVTPPGGKQIRVGRTKGVTYRAPTEFPNAKRKFRRLHNEMHGAF